MPGGFPKAHIFVKYPFAKPSSSYTIKQSHHVPGTMTEKHIKTLLVKSTYSYP